MSKYDDLVRKLKEIFQIDKPELDFGIYRILNARADEINEYLDKRLKERVQEALANAGNANLEQLRKDLADAEKNAESLGMKADDVPKVKELRQQITDLAGGAADHENAVFSHLLTFFSRYYDSGDFISQRRYKGDTYAIPYAGEEVMLHWANKDQYYIKSGENFANFSFKLDDGRTVHFRLVTADTAKDNRKDNDKERCFVLLEKQTRVVTNDEGDEYEEELLPIEEVNGELLIRFEYRSMPKGSKQETLVNNAVLAVLAHDVVKKSWADLSRRVPTEKNPQRTLLEKNLTQYTQKNKADYFIHKDLGRFLRGELDFYIKSEVMNLDDVQHAERFADIEKNLRMIQCLRAIALDLITFLAQLEDFQKKLWLKKKFVVSAHYCVTLDRVIADAPELLAVIAANEKQWEQWDKLGMLDGNKVDLFTQAKAGSVDYLKEHPFLIADTALFDVSFKNKLLAAIDNLDETVDGVLVHGDNFQALQLIGNKYKSQISGIYIDPPYNTDATEIVYKNGYKDSSWCSLIFDRLQAASMLLKENAPLCVTIDECEVSNLSKVMEEVMTGYTLRPVIIEYNHRGRVKSNFSITHEYALWAIPAGKDVITRKTEISDDINRNMRRTGTDSTRQASANQFYGVEVDNETLKIINVTESLLLTDTVPLHTNPNTTMVWPIDDEGIERRWYYGKDRVRKEAEIGTVWAKRIRGEIQIHYHQDGKPKMRKSVWVGSLLDASTYGSELLNDIFGLSQSGFSFPKSIHAVYDCIEAMSFDSKAIFLDFFAGSGTTAHAVISHNRQDSGNRKYILVEQGEYFDAVLKSRIQKLVYSADWKNGKPTSPQSGISHTFKVLKIESYEDTLNNLALLRSEAQQSLLTSLPAGAKEDYLLRYMLDIESQGSILSVNSFLKPFDCKLKVAVDSAGAFEERTIDLVETFNYLIGLKVKEYDGDIDHGYVRVEGHLPTGEYALILWRDCARIGYEELQKYCDRRFDLNAREQKYDVIYINGDNNIPTALTTTEAEGGITKTLRLRQIEPEFLSRMFDGEV